MPSSLSLDAMMARGPLLTDPESIATAVRAVDQPLAVVSTANGPQVLAGNAADAAEYGSLVGMVPAVPRESLGDAHFRKTHGLRYAYVSGAMAAGIGSEAIVEQMAQHGMLGIFGAAGLAPARVEQAIDRLQNSLGQQPFGFNLIHSPNEQDLESGVVDLYLRRGIKLVESSAFLGLTPHVVRYRLTGISRDEAGRVVVPNRVIAKVSRVEVAQKFMSPAPEKLLSQLVSEGYLTSAQARMAEEVPIAEDITAEADSGGHTDNRPLVTLLPTLIALRDRLQEQYRFPQPIRVGAAGGIATPAGTHAAFALGAAYVLVGTVHQACVESGSSDVVRQLLAEAEQADTTMCPCADMFEMGVKVQVLKRGTMFAMRAGKLFEIYRAYPSLEEIPANERAQLESVIFKLPLNEVWRQTSEYFAQRDPAQNEKAARDPKHKMALVFRWYLGQSSRWANVGDPARRLDYQIWCGPSMGAFNEWTRDTFLAQPSERRVGVVAHNLLWGAAILKRQQWLEQLGVVLPTSYRRTAPKPLSEFANSR